MNESEFYCRRNACENPVKDENDMCAECHQEQEEYFRYIERDLQIQQFAEAI